VLGGAVPAPAAEQTRKLKVGEITITYPVDMKPQAEALAGRLREIMPQREAEIRAFHKAIDEGRVATRITQLLGYPGARPHVQRALKEMEPVFRQVQGHASNLRLCRDEDSVPDGSLRGSFTIGRKDGGFFYRPSASEPVAKTDLFLAIIPRDDGTFTFAADPSGYTATEPQGADVLELYADGLVALRFTRIHEAAEMAVVNGLHLYSPFSRWFNEGVANWVTGKMANELAPKLRQRVDTYPDPEVKPELRARVNLPAWLQNNFGNPSPSPEEETLSTLNYHVATKAVKRMFEGQPDDALARVLAILRKRPMAYSNEIGYAITEVTGRDARAILAEYTPEAVRKGIAEGAPARLRREADVQMDRKEWEKAISLLSQTIEMAPTDPDDHAFLAVCMRLAGRPKEVSEREIAITAALSAAHEWPALRTISSDPAWNDEMYYVYGRLEYKGGDADAARRYYDQCSRTHADAQAALKELGR
jgi:tetratricopeptide (TPR) repeat protein